MVTLDDIAKAAGVNKTTVSRALRNRTDINAQTAAKIRLVAANLGYRKKARKGRLAGVVGILCPEIKSEYYGQIIELLNAGLSQIGYMPLIMCSDFDAEREKNLVDMIIGRGVSGLVCITEGAQISAYLTRVSKAKQIPVVQVAVNVEGGETDSICVNDDKCISYAMRHLQALGHRKIAFLGDRFAGARLRYYKRFLQENADRINPDYIFTDANLRHFECGYKLMGDVLKLSDRPTALIAEYDNIALGAMRRIKETGLCVPADFSVIGCDNSSYTSYLGTSLTTIEGHSAEMCAIVVAILKRKMSDPSYQVIQNVQISPELIVRESTGAAKGV